MSSRGALSWKMRAPGLLGVSTPSRGPGKLGESGRAPRGARPHRSGSVPGGERRAVPPCLAGEELHLRPGWGLQVWGCGEASSLPPRGLSLPLSTPRPAPLGTSQDQNDTSNAREKRGAPPTCAFWQPGPLSNPSGGLVHHPQDSSCGVRGWFFLFKCSEHLGHSDPSPRQPQADLLGNRSCPPSGPALSQLLLGRRQTPCGTTLSRGWGSGITGGSLNSYKCPPSGRAGVDDQGNKATDSLLSLG